MRLFRTVFFCFFALLATSLSAAASSRIDWNDKQLRWMSYEQGMSKLKGNDKRGILIIYADWCGTCKAYSKFFRDPEVVNALEGFVLMRANVDADPALSRKYGEDGEYVPRTFALNSSGGILKGAYEKQDKFAYFISADDATELLRFLKRVKAAKQ